MLWKYADKKTDQVASDTEAFTMQCAKLVREEVRIMEEEYLEHLESDLEDSESGGCDCGQCCACTNCECGDY